MQKSRNLNFIGDKEIRHFSKVYIYKLLYVFPNFKYLLKYFVQIYQFTEPSMETPCWCTSKALHFRGCVSRHPITILHYNTVYEAYSKALITTTQPCALTKMPSHNCKLYTHLLDKKILCTQYLVFPSTLVCFDVENGVAMAQTTSALHPKSIRSFLSAQ